MTTVTGVQGDGWAVMSCDTRVTSANEISQMPSEMSKISQNGKYLIAVAGKFKAIPLLAYSFSPTAPPVRAKGLVLDKFMTSVFVPELEAFMVKHFPDKPMPKDGEDTDDEDATGFLVAVHGTIYQIGVEYTWTREFRRKYAIGSGSDYALAVLQTTPISDRASAEKLSRYAIEIASTLDTNTNDTVQTFYQEGISKK